MMRRLRHHVPTQPHSDSDSLDAMLKSNAAPDLTRKIMGRLGYMRAKPQAARRHRVQRGLRRTGLVAAAALALGVGLKVFERSPDARQPGEPIIPAALGQEIERQQQSFGAVIRTLRNVAPAKPVMMNDQVESEADHPKMIYPIAPRHAPLQWT